MTISKKQQRKDAQLDRDIEKAIATRFTEHLMSNSKWVRLIDRLVEHADKVLKVEFKKVYPERMGQLYLNEHTAFNWDYWSGGFEGHNSLGGWLLYKEIEYLLFPRKVDTGSGEQDLVQIQEIIEGVGQFFLEVDEEYLKLICYK